MRDISKELGKLSPKQRELFEALLRQRQKQQDAQAAPGIPRRQGSGPVAASFSQQRLWVLNQLEGGSSSTYNIPVAVRLDGVVDLTAMELGLADLVRRHEALRTTFQQGEDDLPLQVVHPEGTVALPVIDLSGVPEATREAEARRVAAEEARRPFSLEQGPLFRTTLLRLSPERHVLLLSMHHIISDGWSTAVLAQEMAVLYSAHATRRAPVLPPLPVQYADYSVWQRDWMQGPVLKKQLDYWRGQLSGAAPTLALPTDRPRPAAQTFRGSAVRVELGNPLTQAIIALGQRHGATPFMVLLAAWQLLLSRYSGQEDISVGSPIAGRRGTELEGLIGFFVNTLVLRTQVSPAQSFPELLERVKRTTLAAYEHQDVPFERLVEELRPERSLSHSPLFQVMFVLQNTPGTEQRLPGLGLEVLRPEITATKFDLTLALAESPHGFSGILTYSTDLFDVSTVENMVGHYRVLLEALVAGVELPVAQLPLLTPAERQRLLTGWNDTATPFPEDQGAHQLIEAQARSAPDALAVIAGDTRLTRSQLDAKANALAHHLRSLGVGPESRVGLCVERSEDLVVGMLAIHKAGGAFVTLDPTYPADRLAFMVRDAAIEVVLTLSTLPESLLPSGPVRVLLDADSARIAANPSDAPPVTATVPAQLAYIIYTSGSTGRPKGTLLSHRGLVNTAVAAARAHGYHPEGRVLQFASPGFDAAVCEVFATLVAGATLVMAPRERLLPDAPLRALLDEHRITAVTLTPSVLARLEPRGLSSLETVICAGEALSPELVQAWAGRVRLLNAYGPTEVTVCASITREPLAANGTRAPDMGKPWPNTRLYVLNGAMELVPAGVAGELFIGGVGLARGYLGRADLSAEKFVPDPFGGTPGGRLYRSGDSVRWSADGTLEFLGRLDAQVKLRGFRVELGEVESALVAHAGVRQAAAIVRKDGSGDSRLVAYVVPQGDAAIDAASLRARLAEVLPDYMVPAAFVSLPALPLTAHGKLDVRALPVPGAESLARAAARAPETPTEKRVAALWSELLGVESITAADDFFALGGHSLLATQVVSRLRRELGVELPLRALFEAPTLAALAARVDGGTRPSASAPPLQPTSRDGHLPLSFAQQRLWFIDQFEPGSAAYNIPTAVLLEGDLRPELLQQALEALTSRHESLRTTFAALGEDSVQRILPRLDVALPLVDLSSLSASEQDAETRRLVSEEAQRPFNLAEGPLLRARLFRLAPERHVLVLTLHHIVSDGWSMGVLIRELGALYLSLTQGTPSPLAPLPIQYADFAAWQRGWLHGPVLQAQLDFWRHQLTGAPPVLELPTDRVRPAVQTYRGASLPFSIPQSLAARVNALAQRHGATPFMVLLASWQLLLSRYSGQDDISVGSPIAGRTRSELEGLIGFFVNTLVLRARIDSGASFLQLLAQVKQTTLGAYEHQDVPFEKLVEELRPQRSLSHTPLFQVMFSLQNTPQEALDLPRLALRPFALDSGVSKFDLSLSLTEGNGALEGVIDYSSDLFDAATVQRMAAHFQALLETIIANPERTVSSLSFLSGSERQQLLSAWNDTHQAFAWDGCLHERFEAQAARTPDALAVLSEETPLSFSALNQRANQWAGLLRQRGVRPEVRVALCFERSADMLVALLAVLKAGGSYLPIDPAYPAQRIGFMLQDAQPLLVLSQPHLVEALSSHGLEVLCLDDSAAASFPTANPAPLASADHPAYVIYTSGSTGKPKGVEVTQASVMNLRAALARTVYAGVTSPLRVSLNAPLAFDASVQQLVQLSDGHTLCVIPKDVREDVRLMVAWLERHQVQVLDCSPSHLRLLLDEGLGAQPMRVLVGGEAIDEALWARLSAHPRLQAFNVYGPTECTVDSTARAIRGAGPVPTLGGPLANARFYVLDAQLQPVPVGVPGELFIGGAGLARGYLRRPALTAERFIPDAFSDVPGARLYRTGDRVRWLANGELEYLGRIDFQVKLRGFRIELGEIEAALTEHTDVRESAVIVRKDGAAPQLVGYVVPAAGQALDVATLRTFLMERLPEYMVPSALVVLEALPLTTNGKLDRNALPAPHESGTRTHVPPREGTEQTLAGLFEDLLGVKPVGAHDDFFELGGHSLLATQLVSRIRSAFRVELPLRALFEMRTVSSLAAKLDSTSGQSALPPLKPAPAGQPLPQSSAQRRLWYVDRLAPGSAAYNIPAAVRVDGALDLAVMEQALRAVVSRQGALRTTFRNHEELPVQVLHPDVSFTLAVEDLTSLPESAREAQARTLANEEAHRPFDLERGPLFRARMLRLAPEHHVLLVTMHHIISDGWSIGVLVREVAAFYEARLRGGAPKLPELPVQYADFARWQHDWMQGPVLEAELDYWREQLAGAPTALELPTDRPRPAVQANRGSGLPVHLPLSVAQGVQALARRTGTTPFMVMLAAWQLLLSRYSGQEEVSVGSPVAGRNRSELEDLIGFFVNTVILRARLSPQLTVAELLTQVKQATLGATEHQDVPFEKLVEVLKPPRDTSRSPLFQVTFTLQNTPPVRMELPGLSLSVLDVEIETSKFDMSLVLGEGPDGVSGVLNYDTDLFDRATVARMMEHYRVLMEAFVVNEHARLSELSPLPASERQQVLLDWNATSADYPRDVPVHVRFAEQAARAPDAVALVFGDEQLTYGELDQRANQLAHHLRAYGVDAGTRVGLCLERSLELVVGLLGILKAGGAYVPVNRNYPAERISFLLQEAGVSVVVTLEELADELPAGGALFVCLDADEAMIARQPSDAPPAAKVGGDDLAYVMFTSGSTGVPKGVCIPHRGVVRLVSANPFIQFGPDEVFLQLAPVAFDASTLELWGALLHGARLVIAPPGTPSLNELGTLMEKQGVTTLWLTAALFEQAVLHMGPSLAQVRQVLAGGDVLPMQRVLQHLGRVPAGAVLVNGYGPTENTTFSATYTLRPGMPLAASVPIGRPLGHSTTYVLDAFLQPAPVGVPGELFVGGDGLAWGYLNRPDLTAEKFVPHPFSPTPGARLYRTGDRVRWLADGTLEFLGRTDFQVKVRGFRIELGEVESQLQRAPGVQEAVVVVREDVPGDKRLVAYLVGLDGPESVQPRALQDFLAQRLPDYMVPAAFVALEALPLNANGKVDRKALPAPDAEAREEGLPFEAPRTPAEEAVARVWSEVLGVKQVGIDDNYFDLGGDSMRSIQVIAKLREAGLELPMMALLQHPTIRELSTELKSTATVKPPVESSPFSLLSEEDRQRMPEGVEDAYPLTYLQSGMLFESVLHVGTGIYHDMFSLHLEMALDESRMRQALREVMSRHTILRTSFDLEGYSEPLQLVHGQVEPSLRFDDLRHLSKEEQDVFLREWAETYRRQNFDWTVAPLLHATVHRRTESTLQFTFLFHHAILDGWSATSVFTELVGRYLELLEGRDTPAEPPLTVTYRQFVALERDSLASGRDEKFWLDRMSEVEPPAARPPSQSGQADMMHRQKNSVSADLQERLQRVAQELGVSLKSVLLATHLRVASFVEGSNAVVTGLVSNGRPEVADGERMIGLFLNSVPFPLELSGGTWRELIREVSKREREVLPHRRYPMARLKKQLGGQPLFQTLFNFVHFHVMGDMMKRDGMRVVEEVNAAAWIEFPLNVSFSLDPATTALNFSVSSTGVTRDTAWVKNVSQYYLRALESLATNPDGRYDQATLLSQEEQQRLLRDWNATRQSFPWEGCLHERFEAQAARSPDALAVLSDEASYSFDALNQRANQWAWLLRQRGVRPEVRVALCFERSADMLVALFAILKAGGSYVPVDPAYPAQRIGFMLQDAQPLLVLSQPHLTESLAPHGFDVLCLDDAAASGFPTTNPPPLASAAHPAYVIYTSGSTGKPKGVEVTHASVMNLRGQLARAVYSGVTSPLRVSLNAPLSFDASVKQLVQISDGHTLCVIPKEMREDMRLMVAWLERHQLDVLDCSPSHLRLLLDEGLGSRPMHVLIGGEAIDDVLWARLTSHPQIQAFNVYGPTECTVDSTAKTVRGAGPHPSMGGPLANTRIYILDAHLNPVPANVPGELFIGGAGLARGYLNRPDLTAERFIPDAFSDEPGARLYRTGDRVRWLPDGEVEYVGRIDFQVKLRGFRIELSEIEAALRSHPDVDAAVVLVHDFSESDKRLVAYVVAGDSVDTDSLRVFLRERLPDFMVPALFVPLSAIPLTTNGKVDRRALPSPTASQLLDSRAFEAPRTPTEVRLASLWAQLLRVDQVGRTDDFFALGGHSLLATQVVSRLRKDAGIELPLRALFEAPTLAALASRIDASSRPSASAPPLLPTSREGHLPLSFAQQRLWFIDQLEPGSAVYNIPTAVLLEGTLQPDLLQQALEALTLRHESLRTTFAASGEDAFQRILAHLEVPLPLVDLGGLNPAAQDAETRRLVSEEAAHPFNLAEGPLLRARLFRLAPERHVLVLTLHHIVSDGWSMGVLIRELGALYLSLAQGTPSPLAPLPVQYADFAAWQRGWLHGPVLQAQLDFWRDQLEGAPPVLELPTDRARPAVQTYRGDSLSFDIPQSLASRINALAQRHGATPFMVLLASWQLLLSRYSGQDDISVGSPIAGRTRSELEGLIGFFVNTLVLRARIDSGASFLQLLAQVKQTTLGAYEHQDVPFEKLVEELRPQRSLSHSPLFQVMFSLQNTPQQALDLTSLSVRPLSFDSPLAKFDLTLALGESQGGYGGTLNYNTDLFAAETAQRMVAHFNALVEAVTTHPERSVSSLSFLSGSERQQLLSAWNDTHQAFAWDGCLQERFEAQAARTPDALAVLSDEVSLSFSALNQRANQWAGLLRQRGVRPEVRVALCFERSADMLVALLAVLKAGGSYLPIDPAYPAQRIGFMLQDAQPLLVLSQPRLAESLAPHGFEVLCLDDRAAADFPTENPSPLASADHPAYVIYTSGSTGKPKGVEVTHASVMNLRAALARTVYAGVTSPLRVSLNAPISFDASVQQLVQLSDGHALCVVPQAAREDASLLVEWTEKHHVDVLDCAPSHLRMLFDAGLGARSLRVLVGGEAIDDALWAQLSAHPRLQAFNVYGPTECTVDSTARAIRGAGARPTLGGPLANVRFYVLDSQLQPLPTGAPGELFIGGAGLARGYLNRPDLTAERFVPDPFASIPGRRMYRTGDRVRWLANGELEYLGRIDFQVKLRGFRIELGEIEAALLAHPDVNAAVVLVHAFSDSDKRLVAYVVAGDSVDTDSLRVFLRERLPDFMVPALFVSLATLPLTPNGKVDRKALPAPTTSQRSDSETFEAPRTPTEVRLASLWAQLLRVDKVGRGDDFFALGGHSLLATQVVSRVRKELGIELPLRALFEAPTLALLAARIDSGSRPSASAPPLLPVSREGQLPLSFAQQRLWFIDQLEPGSAAYNIPTAVLLEGDLQPALLQQALEALTLRHESLRTTFVAQSGDAAQHILPRIDVPLPLVDLSGLAQAEQDAQTRRLVSEEAQRPFDLAKGPLLRGRLFRLAPERHVLVLTLHHIVSDGWSMGVLIRELGALYLSLAQGTPSPLLPLPVQYADFAAWQRGWLHGPVLQAQLDFWRNQLTGAPPILELPTDRPRPAVQTYRGASLPFSIPQSLVSRVHALAQRHGATPFMVLLASWQLMLSRYSGQDDISVGSPIAGRTRSELEGLIGFFVNTLVLRARIDSGASFLQLLAQVKQTTLGAYEHQDVPFEKLVEELRPQRSLSHSPLFQVMFSLQNTPQEALDLTSLSVRPLSFDSPLAKFDLSLMVTEANGAFEGVLGYSSDLFDGATAQRMATHFHALIAAIVEHPERAVSSLSFLSGDERQQLLTEWNDLRTPLRRGLIHQRISEQAARTPEATALVVGTERLSYRELEARSNRLAHLLQSRGVGPDVRVAVCMTRSSELVVSLLAILKAGGAYVPLDPNYPRQRIDSTLSSATPRLLLSHQALLASLQVDFPAGSTVFLDALPSDFASLPTSAPATATVDDNLAYLIYTSGSTGKPKGVSISHASASSFLDWATRTFSPAQLAGTLAATSICFDLSVFELFAPLSCGGCVLLADDALALATLPASQEVTLLNTVPSAVAELLRLGAIPASVRTINLAGEPLPGTLARALYQSTSVQDVFNLYGPTEDTTYSTFTRVPADVVEPSIGAPLPQSSAYILSPQLQLQPVGAPGELYLAGAGLARGYLGQPDFTAERFVPDPFATTPGSRMYRTGDRARWLPNGQLEYLGRIDFQVKLRGFRIELGEIESVLRAHAGINTAVVLVHAFSDNDKRLVAYVVPASASDFDSDAVRHFVRERLPDFMVPALFVPMDALPLTPNGKVDRKALPAPVTSQLSDSHSFEAPRTPTEVRLASLWAQLLRVDKVGRGDDFFALGGHSLLATQVVSRLRRELGVELPLRALFEAPTLAALASRIDAGTRASASAPPLQPASRDGHLPLSFAQQRLWFIDQLEPGSAAYNIATAVILEGDLQPTLLQQALEALTARHESLRTTFTASGEDAVQRILPNLEVPLPLVDLSGLEQAEQDAQTRRLVSEEAARPFSLSEGPLLRARLFRLASERHVLVLTLHHIVSDGWSTGVLIRELGALYLSRVQGTPSPLAPLPIQYADFAAWQRGWLHGPVLQAQLDFWRNQLNGAPPILELPTDRPRPAVQTYRGASLPFSIPQTLAARINGLAQRHGATPFMVLLASWQLLLSRYSGQDDISVGSPIAGRTRSELEGLIGFFVNTLVLRARIDSGASFLQLLAQVKQTTLGAYEHQDVPFEKLVEELRPQRSLSHSPLFQVMFSLQNTPQEALDLTSLSVRPLSFDSSLAKFDLTLALAESNGGYDGTLNFNSDLFDGATAQRMATHFHALIAAIVEHPEHAVSSLSFLSGGERQQLLTEWNDLRTPLRRGLIHQRISEQAARTPEATALVVGTERLSYRELEARSNRLAHLLQSRGVGPDVRVAVCMTRSSELVVSLLAILKAGGAYVPLDPNYPRQRIDSTLSSATPRLLLSHQALLASLQLDFPAGSTVFLDALPSDFASLPTSAPATATVDDNLAYLIYTSGSTGKPKGVSISHASASSFLDWATRTFSPAQLAGTLAATSICFDLSVFELFAPLSCGGCVLLADDALALATLPAAQEVTLLNTVPSAVAELLRLGAIPASVRTINLAGEPLPGTLARALYQSTSVQDVFNLYGPTEDTTYSTFTRVPADVVEPSIGAPLPQSSAYVLSPQLQLQPVGAPGELYLAGAGLARGYLGQPDFTAERFVPDPFATTPGSRMYRTGDRARWLPNGELEYLGRIDFQVKLRGFRIELGEIESTLRAHPDVDAAVVVVHTVSENDKRLVAYVVPVANATLEPEALRAHVRQQLPAFMVPSAVITLSALPLTPNGKVDRKALPALDTGTASRSQIAPRDAAELELARLFEEVLGVQSIGARDDFFQLGGHSFLAVRLIAQVRERLGRNLPIAALFQAPTVEELATLLRQEPRTWSPLVPLQPEGTATPFFCVHPVGGNVFAYVELARRLGRQQPIYGLQAQGLDGGLPPRETLTEMASAYVDAIRTVQPHGPYRLGGWSLGAVVAYEMARLLQTQGETVDVLALIEPSPTALAKGATTGEDASATTLFALDLARTSGVDVSDAGAWSTLSAEAQLEALLQKGRESGVFVPEVGLEQLRTLQRVFVANHQALRQHTLQPYSGALTVFRGTESDATGSMASDRGWGALAAKAEVVDVPGDHYSLFRAPALDVLVKALASLLKTRDTKSDEAP